VYVASKNQNKFILCSAFLFTVLAHFGTRKYFSQQIRKTWVYIKTQKSTKTNGLGNPRGGNTTWVLLKRDCCGWFYLTKIIDCVFLIGSGQCRYFWTRNEGGVGHFLSFCEYSWMDCPLCYLFKIFIVAPLVYLKDFIINSYSWSFVQVDLSC